MRYHPHSDLSVYETIIRLSQDFNKLNPFIEKQGNVGSVDDFKSFAAQRYVELRLAKFSNDVFFEDMSTKYIPMKDNYDGSCLEPDLLPAKFPVILNSAMMGIASGFATEIPPHKVDDICNLTIRYINSLGSEISTKDLIKDFRPDFPAGAVISNESSIVEMYEKGRGTIYVEANIDEGMYNKKPALIVRDLPFRVSTSKILGELQSLVATDSKTKQAGVLADKLADVKDLSSKTQSVELVLIPKKDVSLAVLKNILLESTSLRSTVKYLPNVIINNDLVEHASIKQILQGWLDFRVNILSRKFNYEIQRSSEQQLLKKALIKAHAKIDEVIKIVKGSASKDVAIEKLQKLLKITRREGEYIVNIHLYQISKLEVTKLDSEIAALQEVIDNCVELISNPESMLSLIKDQLTDMAKKYKSKRKTTLQNTYQTGNFDVRSVIESEDIMVAISTDNYVYAKPVADMREYVARGAKGSNFIDAKYKRVIRDMFMVNSHDDLFVFTDTGKVIELKGYELNLWHKPISNAIPDLGSQKVVTVIKANKEEDADKLFTFVTKNSVMKRVYVSDMASTRKMQGGNIAIRIDEGDDLIGVALVESDEDRIVITSNHGRAQNMTASCVSPALRPTRGFPKAILAEGEEIQCITVIPENQIESALILVAASNGIGKVVSLSDLPERRGESGKRAMMKIITLKGNADLVCGLLVNAEDTLIATTTANKTNKISVSLVNQSKRQAMGVKLITLDGNDTLFNVAIA